MPLYLQRIRFSVRTRDRLFAGTHSKVELHYVIEKQHQHPSLEPDEYCLHLNHPFHDDFQRGEIDSYEIDLTDGSPTRSTADGAIVPSGLVLPDWDDARALVFHLTIDGSDRWEIDRYILAGYFQRLDAPADPETETATVDLGWVEMARHEGPLSMSTNPKEGVAEVRIDLNGQWY